MNKIKIRTGLELPYKRNIDTSGLRHFGFINDKVIKILKEKLNLGETDENKRTKS